jgi:short-subunit dehydrogenase
VSSVGGRLGIVHESAYCADKFTLSGWSESMAVVLRGTGVTVKLIQPEPVDTDIWDQPGDADDPLYDGPKVSPVQVADGVIAALDSDTFEHYIPDMKAVVDLKNADIDTTSRVRPPWRNDEGAGLRHRPVLIGSSGTHATPTKCEDARHRIRCPDSAMP